MHLPILQVGKVFWVNFTHGNSRNAVSAEEQARQLSGACLPLMFSISSAFIGAATLAGEVCFAGLRAFVVAFGLHWIAFFAAGKALTADPNSTAADWWYANDSTTERCGQGRFSDVLDMMCNTTVEGELGTVRMRVQTVQYEVVRDDSLEARRSVAAPAIFAAQRQLVRTPRPSGYIVSGLPWGKYLYMMYCFASASVWSFVLPGVKLVDTRRGVQTPADGAGAEACLTSFHINAGAAVRWLCMLQPSSHADMRCPTVRHPSLTAAAQSSQAATVN